MSPEQIWWDQIPSGLGIKKRITDGILQGCNIIINPQRVPWHDELVENVHREIMLKDSEINWNYCDASLSPDDNPLVFLRDFLGVEHHPSEQIMLQNLRNTPSCCWVHNIPVGHVAKWKAFARNLQKTKSKLILILELPIVNDMKTGKVVLLDTVISRFDIYYFALSLLSERRLGDKLTEYAATLCVELSNGDPMHCSAACQNIEDVLTNPINWVDTASGKSPMHHGICHAQVRSISPLIDIGRLQLISCLGSRWADILPQQDEYRTTIDQVNNVELRHMVFFKREGTLTLTFKEKDILTCMYDARNDISHLKPLSYQRVIELFKVLEQLEKPFVNAGYVSNNY